MATRIFSTIDPAANARAARAAWREDSTQTVLYDGAGRYAVGFLGAIEEDLDRLMDPDQWEWFEVAEDFYSAP